MQHLPTIGFQQHVLHAEGDRAQSQCHKTAHRAAAWGILSKIPPCLRETRLLTIERGARGIPHLLLPQCHQIERHRRQRRTLDYLDQPDLAEMGQQAAEDQGADDHAEQQHHAKQRDNARMRLRGGKIGRQCQSDRLRGVQARPHQKKRQSGTRLADPDRAMGITGKHQQRERHDGEAAELKQRAHPDIRHPAPAQHGAVRVRTKPDQGTERGKYQRQ